MPAVVPTKCTAVQQVYAIARVIVPEKTVPVLQTARSLVEVVSPFVTIQSNKLSAC